MDGRLNEDDMKNCLWCQAALPTTEGRGKAKAYCTPEHKEAAAQARAEAKVLQCCTVEGCTATANRKGNTLCEAHYMRVRRNGTTASQYERAAQYQDHSNGYLLVKAQGHPRSLGMARAYAHRVVFTDTYGEGPFKCNWCPNTVTWDDMHVDHLDDDKHNNHPDNLVASCQVCNMKRGRGKLKQLWRARYGIEFNGLRLTPNEWAARLGISGASLAWRLKRWPLARALTEGRGCTGPLSTRDLVSK